MLHSHVWCVASGLDSVTLGLVDQVVFFMNKVVYFLNLYYGTAITKKLLPPHQIKPTNQINKRVLRTVSWILTKFEFIIMGFRGVPW